MSAALQYLRKNRTQLITLAALGLLFVMAIQSMNPEDWVITALRGLSTGAITFLVAAGFSLIFGLMDVLNLAHGTLFMVGAYVGWTVFVRPDTAVDAATPVALVLAGLALLPVFDRLIARIQISGAAARVWPWISLVLAGAALWYTLPKYPITTWDVGSFEISPTNYAFAASQGQLVVPEPETFSGISPAVDLLGIYLGAALGAAALAGFSQSRRRSQTGSSAGEAVWKALLLPGIALVVGLAFYFTNDSLTAFLVSLNSTWLFVLALVVAAVLVGGIGALMESSLIRPLYATPVNQLLLTLGVSFIGIEVVRTIWGNPEFTMPRPAIFNGQGEGCPAESLGDLIAYQCSTIRILGERVRTYNEIFIPILGVIILIAVWLLLQRTRLGMTIRAGVQDSEMVEALSINVRRVFTLVFALGVGLAALGGVVAAPSSGLSTAMGETLLLNALIALAIGGLTSYPGAAAGSLLVGMMQQFIIKYGQLGIPLPFLEEPFKPTPPLVPASTVLLMVVILLLLPQGLFGRRE